MKRNKNMSKFTAIVLLITMLTLIAIAGIYAKYTTAFTGTGTVHTANWDIELTGDNITNGEAGKTFTLNNEETIYPGKKGTLATVTVTNNSEEVSAVISKLEITPKGEDLPKNLKLTVNDDQKEQSIAPGGTQVFTIDYDWTWSTEDETQYANKDITFDVQLTVDQVQQGE